MHKMIGLRCGRAGQSREIRGRGRNSQIDNCETFVLMAQVTITVTSHDRD